MSTRRFDLSNELNLAPHFDSLEARLVMSRDTLGPVAPDEIVLAAGSDTGVAVDFITADRTPEFSWRVPRDRGGIFAAGTSTRYEWRIERVNANSTQLTAFGSGPTRGASTPLVDGDYRFMIRYQDNGNRWGDWGQRGFEISSRAPLPPTIRLIDTPSAGGTATSSTNPSFELGPSSEPYAEFYTALQLSTGRTIYGISQSNIVRPAESLAGNLPEGTHTLFVRARDGAGQLNANWSGLTFTVDRTAPPTFDLRYVEWNDAATSWYISLYGDPMAQNLNRIFAWFPPTNDLPSTYFWQVHNAQGTILADGRIDQSRFWSPPVTLSVPGATTFYLIAADHVGNLSPWMSLPVDSLGVFDLRGPEPAPDISMRAQDDTGEVGDARTTNPMPLFTWSAPTDYGGRQLPSSGGYGYSQLLYAPGTASGTSPHLRWTISQLAGYGFGNDPIIETGDENSRRGPSTPLAPGRYLFSVVYDDLAGNQGSPASIAFEIATGLESPQIRLPYTGDSPSDDIIGIADPVFVFEPPSEDGINYAEYYWAFHRSDGTQFHGISPSATVRPSDTYAALASLPDGRHAMYVRARTPSGALTSGWSEKIFTVDTTPPAALPRLFIAPNQPFFDPIRLTDAPVSTDIHRGGPGTALTVVWQLPADSNRTFPDIGFRMYYQIQTLDGTIVSNDVISQPGRHALSLSDPTTLIAGFVGISWLPSGTYRLFATAMDNEGNFGNWTEAEGGPFTLDATAPTAPVIQSGPTDTLATGAEADFSWLGSTDAEPGPVRYIVKFEHITGNNWWDIRRVNSFRLVEATSLRIAPDFGFGPGRVRWSVFAIDQAGHASESNWSEFTLV